MKTSTPESDERFPTVGPDPQSYDRYSLEWTSDGDARICEESVTDAWIASARPVSLDAWR